MQGVNELAAFLGQRGSGQFAHLGDYVRGQSYRKPILHLAAVDVMPQLGTMAGWRWCPLCASHRMNPGPHTLHLTLTF